MRSEARPLLPLPFHRSWKQASGCRAQTRSANQSCPGQTHGHVRSLPFQNECASTSQHRVSFFLPHRSQRGCRPPSSSRLESNSISGNCCWFSFTRNRACKSKTSRPVFLCTARRKVAVSHLDTGALPLPSSQTHNSISHRSSIGSLERTPSPSGP